LDVEGACISVRNEERLVTLMGAKEDINVGFLFDRDGVGNEGECGCEVKGEVRAYSYP
jgi:hypothetical protein